MMKSFFKKLAFVMALAMVVSMAAPAATTASAAEEMKIGYQNGAVITELNLTEVRSSEDLKAVGAPSNWKELGINWVSSNPAVATVDNAGVVTAVSAGTADIMATCGDYTVTITVNCFADAKAYDVTIGTADERSITEKTLKVGAEFDFAFFGVKDYGRDKVNNAPRYFCEWDSTDTAVATVDKNGLVKAVAPGKAKITLIVWNLATGTKHNVTPTWVTVAADATPTPVDVVANLNKTQNTIEVTFPATTELALADVEMYRVFNADDDNNGDGVIDARDAFEPYQDFYVYAVKDVKDTNKTVWTLTTFDDFADGATYEVRVKGYEAEQFVASVGPVAKVVAWEKTPASLASDEGDVDAIAATLGVTLYDAKGVDVTTRLVNGVANNDISNISYELTSESNAYNLYDNEIMFYEKATAVVKAIFDDYDATTPIESTPIAVTPSPVKAYGVAEIVAWTVFNTNDSSWSCVDWNGNLSKVVPADEESYVIVTLLKDTRGNYFSTHLEGTEKKYKDANGVEHVVHWTEDSDAAFWINGAYVEYKAMSPDKMLVETDGTIKSYEKGTARFALYLYDYNKQTVDGLVRELYSQNLTVCHEMKLAGFEPFQWNDYDVMMNTASEKAANNFYNIYSNCWMRFILKDIHGGNARADHAAEANFEVTLVNDVNDEDLIAFAQKFEDTLNSTNGAERDCWFQASDFGDYDGNYVRLTITETKTKVKKSISITLTRPAEYEADGSAKVHTISEYLENMDTNEYFEKFVTNRNNFTVYQAITDAKNDESYKNNGYNLVLAQVDKKNHEIGIDNNLYIATKTNVKTLTLEDIVGVATTSALQPGDRVVVVTAPNGKEFYKDADDAFGIEIRPYDKNATDPSWGNEVECYQYTLVFRTVDPATGKVTYAKDGKYTVAIYTVEEYIDDPTAVINFAESTGLRKTINVTVSNNNAAVKYAGRDAIRLEGSVDALDAQDILDAFNFSIDGAIWSEDTSACDWALDASDIIGWETTKAASNNQIVVNTVTFKVPVMGYDAANDKNSKADGVRYGWYEYKCTVNKAITFE